MRWGYVLSAECRFRVPSAAAPTRPRKSTQSDYVYNMHFADGKIGHMTKIWNAGWALKELGW